VRSRDRGGTVIRRRRGSMVNSALATKRDFRTDVRHRSRVGDLAELGSERCQTVRGFQTDPERLEEPQPMPREPIARPTKGERDPHLAESLGWRLQHCSHDSESRVLVKGFGQSPICATPYLFISVLLMT